MSSIPTVITSPPTSIPTVTVSSTTPPTVSSTSISTTPGGSGGSTDTSTAVAPPTTRTQAPTADNTPSRTTTTSTASAVGLTTSTLSETSTRVYETSSTLTSDGQVYTTLFSVTTTLSPGSVVSSTSAAAQSSSSGSNNNLGVIIGGVVGGLGAIALIGVLCFFLFSKKRRLKNEFDGNFDPLAVSHGRMGSRPSGGPGRPPPPPAGPGGTLPKIDVEEDDGMGGRLARGAQGGGVISPYPFSSPPNRPPSPPHGGHTQMGQYGGRVVPGAMVMANAAGPAGAVAYGNDISHRRTPSNVSSGLSTTGTNYYNHGGQLYAGQPPLPTTNVNANTGAYNAYAPPIGRGPSPGPSVMGSGNMSDTVSQSQYSSSSAPAGYSVGGASGNGASGRNAKEIEAFGKSIVGTMMMPMQHVMNPDDEGQYPHPHQQQQQQQHYKPGLAPMPVSQQQQQQYYQPSMHGASSSTLGPRPSAGAPASSSSSGKPAPITLAPSPPMVHQDAGRVELEEGPSEIPPAYDSLPADIRR